MVAVAVRCGSEGKPPPQDTLEHRAALGDGRTEEATSLGRPPLGNGGSQARQGAQPGNLEEISRGRASSSRNAGHQRWCLATLRLPPVPS